MISPMLGHGGAAGLVFEFIFLGVPVVIFGVLSLLARRKRNREGSEGGEGDDVDTVAGW